jgi:hypothetical protein
MKMRVFLAALALAGLAAVGLPSAAGADEPSTSPPATSAAAPDPAEVEAVRSELARLRDEFAAARRQYDERLLALEQRLGQLTGGPSVMTAADAAPASTPAAPEARLSPAAPAPAAAAPQEAPGGGVLPAQAPGLPAGSAKVFNPDMSVIGNFVGAAGRNPFSTQPPFELNEAEAAFQAVVDPYARADFFLAASPEGLEVEEGYVTFTSLPSHLLLKAGKMRASFGKVNTLHTHAMPTVDRPLVTGNLVGGEEGLSDSGVSLSRLFPNPYFFLEGIGEVYAARSDVFRTESRSRLNYVGHLRAYRDISEDMNLDLGASIAHGPVEGLMAPALLVDPAAPAEFSKRLIGVDATFRYRPLRRAIYRRLNLRTELIWSRQDLPSASAATAFGLYGLGEYQFAQRWYLGARFDRSGRGYDGDLVDTGGSVFLTFWPTEFSQIRSQYRRTNYAEGPRANELLFQLNFAIGAHGAHAF